MRLLLPLALLALGACTSTSLPPLAPIPASSRPVPIDPANPQREVLGGLRYLGGVEISSPDKRVGGFSSLKRQGSRLVAITDGGDWAVIDPIERKGRLVGARLAEMGDLHGPDGEVLEGTDDADAESLTPYRRGWLVSFEHRHRILYYPSLAGRPEASGLDPAELFGALEPNNGVETIASRNGRTFACAERLPREEAANCMIVGPQGREPVAIGAPGGGLDPGTAYPVDADWASDGTLYILMRSWSGGNDNRGAVVRRSANGALQTLAAFVRPTTTDNYEGIAVRQEGKRTFLYIVSDDNFKVYDRPGQPESWQHTYLMKFEVAH